ncbi:unnamed protein product [Danaus chrysippus]|uniref:Elongator complex protein 5 n=1 Tax=Danaus chrysippus TaxID=151541 RepID=A0A8J2QBM3_9NEOP|nr:unnamed protein product [Danaus chrysippus]
MALFKIKSAFTVLIEDDINKNILPLLIELLENTEGMVQVTCYEQPLPLWQTIIHGKSIKCLKGFDNAPVEKSICVVDSLNQMVLDLGWSASLNNIKSLQTNSNVTKLILILHRDCLFPNSKIETHLHHISNAVISFDEVVANKIWVQVKKSGKIFKSEEIMSYDATTSTFKLSPVLKEDNLKVNESEKVSPGSLTTFKIETDQIQQLEKNKLKLPYMNKINEGKGKVFYEPDVVDDWDDEDPDEDLDI